MLNVGMTELLCFAIIALLVLGPEKLPEAARFAAKWYGKAKRMISTIQNEIDQGLKLSEFREEMQKEIERISELEQCIQKQIEALQHQKTNPFPTESTEHSSHIKTESHLSYSHIKQPIDQLHLAPFEVKYIQQHFSILSSRVAISTRAVQLKIAV